MKTVLKDFLGIISAFLMFWVIGVLLLPIVAMVWPVDSNVNPYGLKAQHYPAMSVAFVFALYTFRRITTPRRSKG